MAPAASRFAPTIMERREDRVNDTQAKRFGARAAAARRQCAVILARDAKRMGGISAPCRDFVQSLRARLAGEVKAGVHQKSLSSDVA